MSMEEVPKVYPKAGSVYASYLPDDWNPLAQWDADNQYQAEGDEEEPQGVFIEDGGHGKHYPGPGGKVIAWYALTVQGRESEGTIAGTEWDWEPEQIMVDAPAKPEHRAVAKAARVLRAGGRAQLKAEPKEAWGQEGSFSFPRVEPGARVQGHVKVAAIERGPSKTKSDMVYEERLGRADGWRKAGNELLARGENKAAKSAYEAGLSYVDDSMLDQLFGSILAEARSVRHPLLLNLAHVELSRGYPERAESLCDLVLETEGNGNAKALYRRGKARRRGGKLELAIEDFTEAARQSPGDRRPRQELASTSQELNQIRRHMFQGKFECSPRRESALTRLKKFISTVFPR